ncbi:MAG: ABC transporter permease subunit [Candidatus Promineifilaceae bacterium]|nr:ABC transporter permease subunit [Candidatus Promineifilaceae bacterium]
MAEMAGPPPQTELQAQQSVPFWRDTRILGVFGQIGFIILVILFFRLVGTNFAANVNRLGESQFICRDGTFSYLCAYDFMSSEAGFDIGDTVLEYVNTDSYWYAFFLGVLNTLKVGLLSVFLTTFLGLFVGIARLSKNWLVNKVALAYIELFRNTPILLQLFFIYFTVILAFPDVREAAQPLGLPIYISNRGLSIPSPELTSSAAIWLAFLILGVIQFQVLWIFLGRREEKTGRSSNRWGWGIVSFLLIAGIGWFVAGAVSDTQGLMAPVGSRIREVEDLEKIIQGRTGLNFLSDIDTLSDDEIAAATFHICVLRDSASETNLTRQLRAMNIPYQVHRSDRYDQATGDYADGTCEAFAAPRSVLAAERSTLENPNAHNVTSVKENPIVWSLPSLEGLNIAGGSLLRPEFTALLVGLTLFYGAQLAEIVRAGIQSVGKGQNEAARALGLNESQRLRLVVLPQALKVIIPPLIGVYLSLMKDTSLGIAIGFPDMYMVSFTTMNQSGRALQLMVLMMLVYLTISLVFSLLLNWYNERTKLVER